jgi:hypothetical protein
MISTRFFRPLHEHADPAQRVLGVAQLAPDSPDLAQLLAADPAPEVRAAAARRCTGVAALGAALATEPEPSVRAALEGSLGPVLALASDDAAATALLQSDHCSDVIRAEVARTTADAQRRQVAIAAMRDEHHLVAIALAAEHAETRLAAAERVHAPDALRQLLDGARNKDRGVARLAKQRLETIENRQDQQAEADAILAEMEALAQQPGPILTAAIQLDRRWRTLDMAGDAERLARRDAIAQAMQQRFEREQQELRARANVERRTREWLDALAPPTTAEALAARRAELAALRTEAQELADAPALVLLEQAGLRLAQWEPQLQALMSAEALVVEAEQLAADTTIDNANLPQRWQALDLAIRTPALTRRFEAALIVIEQRRLAQIRAAQQETTAVRGRLHGLLHEAETALAAGQLHAARAAYDATMALKPDAGQLPKPTQQRVSRLAQKLIELERWESFGQQGARVQLCERAEALAAQPLDPPRLAAEVQKLRAEWKALDQQHAGVPKSLWERFDAACEKAYAPASAFFAQQAAQRKQARTQREGFIAAAAEKAPTLLAEPHDWRAIEHWLRDTDRAWREGGLGSVDPGSWKKLDARLKAATAPVRDALTAAREAAKEGRRQLIAEVTALAAKATERDTPSQVKAIQVRWQEQAKAMPIAHRDERTLWEQFRAACDQVFNARHAERREADERRNAGRRALEAVCAQLEQLAHATDLEDAEVRRAMREAQEQWNKGPGSADPARRDLEPRWRKARAAVETLLASRARAREAVVWQGLMAKERLCEELDELVLARATGGEAEAKAASVRERWAALPPLAGAWESRMAARRDAALRALPDADSDDAWDHRERIEKSAAARLEGLAELEMQLGIETPAEFQAQRLAVQVKRLRERFKSTPATPDSMGERLLAWCELPGVTDARGRQRCDRIIAALERGR